MKNNKTIISVCALIGVCFLLTGAEYITWWLYRLPIYLNDKAVDILSEGVGYIFQALGIFLFYIIAKKDNAAVLNKRCFAAAMAADFIFCAASFFTVGLYCILIFGFLMNFMHGVVAGFYLTQLCLSVPPRNRGVVFGAGYAFGSVSTWLISNITKADFLASPDVFIAYIVMAAVSVILFNVCVKDKRSEFTQTEPVNFDKTALPLAASTVIMLSLVKGLGFYFPSIDATEYVVSAEAVRAFYAIGLIAAGLISDRSRKWGAIGCVLSLTFPFLSFAMRGEPNTNTALWISGYIFFGFFAVYRVLLFSDFASKENKLLAYGVFGLMFGRIGDALGAIIGIYMHNALPYLIWIAASFFIATVLLFIIFYNKTYIPAPTPDKSMEMMMHEFEEAYGLSAREADVFALIINGRSNSEIAAELYISENTVKFHVKNILRKTECDSRTALISRFRKENMY